MCVSGHSSYTCFEKRVYGHDVRFLVGGHFAHLQQILKTFKKHFSGLKNTKLKINFSDQKTVVRYKFTFTPALAMRGSLSLVGALHLSGSGAARTILWETGRLRPAHHLAAAPPVGIDTRVLYVGVSCLAIGLFVVFRLQSGVCSS